MNRMILALAVVVASLAGCATQNDLADWQVHPTHFASGDHLAFSLRNRHAPPVLTSADEIALAREQGWWGALLEEGLVADVAGRWVGTWSGHDSFNWPWGGRAQAEFTQSGRHGTGRLVLVDTLTMDVPQVVTFEGVQGVPLVVEVVGSVLVVKHPRGGQLLTGVFRVDGDRMTGRLRGSSAQLVLTRRR